MPKIQPFADYLIDTLSLDRVLVSSRKQSVATIIGAMRLFGLESSGFSERYAKFQQREAELRERIEDIVVESIPSPPERSLQDYIALARTHYERQGFTISRERDYGFDMEKRGKQYWTHFTVSGLDAHSQTLYFTLFGELSPAHKKL